SAKTDVVVCRLSLAEHSSIITWYPYGRCCCTNSPSQPIYYVSAHAAEKVPRNKTLSTETCPPGGHSLRSRHRRAAERLRHSGGWLERDLTRRSSECCDLNRRFLSQFRVWDSGRVEDLWNATLRCCKRQPRLGP